MTTTIIDYGSGNLRSAAKAFARAAAESGGDPEVAVTAEPEMVARADRIVLPGVGAFADCRAGLLALDGMREALDEAVRQRGVPFLGICVGMQLMATRGLEHGCHAGFDWIAGDVVALTPDDPALKVPQIGWNDLHIDRAHPVLADIGGDDAYVYFVHSYHLAAGSEHVLAHIDYGGRVAAVVGRDNLVGTQFHPEKSQTLGLRLIANFLSWTP